MTVSPIGLRPHFAGPNYERLVAFMMIGCLFGIAYPRHLLRIALIVVGCAFAFEFLQLLSPSRHARLLDALVKSCGGISGLVIASLINRIADRVRTGKGVR